VKRCMTNPAWSYNPGSKSCVESGHSGHHPQFAPSTLRPLTAISYGRPSRSSLADGRDIDVRWMRGWGEVQNGIVAFSASVFGLMLTFHDGNTPNPGSLGAGREELRAPARRRFPGSRSTPPRRNVCPV